MERRMNWKRFFTSSIFIALASVAVAKLVLDLSFLWGLGFVSVTGFTMSWLSYTWTHPKPPERNDG